MQRITITLMNLYDADTTLLDNLVLPDQIDRDDFIGRLMIDIGESEVYITNPRIMRIAIGAWSRGRLPVWKRLAAILDTEYNPIWNVDGETTHTGSNTGSRTYGRQRGLSENDDYTRDRDQVETLTRTQGIDTAQNGTASGTSSETVAGTSSETVSGTTGETITTDIDTTTSETETVTGQLSADNVETWSNDTKTDTVKSGSGTDDRTETKSGNSSENKSGQTSENKSGQTGETTSSTGSEDLEEHSTTNTAEDIADNRKRTETETFTDDESSTGADTWKEIRQGNIGVTTTQKMLTEEWAFWSGYDIIDYIIKQFAEEFCLLVY